VLEPVLVLVLRSRSQEEISWVLVRELVQALLWQAVI